MVRFRPLPGFVVTNKIGLNKLDYLNSIEDELLKEFKSGIFSSILTPKFNLNKRVKEGEIKQDTPSIYLYSIRYRYAHIGATRTYEGTVNGFLGLAHVRDLRRHEDRNPEKIEKIKDSVRHHNVFFGPILVGFNSLGLIDELYEKYLEESEEFFRENIPLKDIPNLKNYSAFHTLLRLQSKEGIEFVKRRLSRVPYGIILDGHHRYDAIVELGYKWIPTYMIDYLDPHLLLLSWNRVIKGMNREKYKAVLNELLSGKFNKKHGVRIYKADIKGKKVNEFAKDIKTALYLSKKKHRIENIQRTSKEIPQVSSEIAKLDRPYFGEIYRYPTSLSLNVIQTGTRFPPSGKWYKFHRRYWIEGTKKIEKGEKLLNLFAIYSKISNSKEAKLYYIGTTSTINEFTQAIDKLILKYVSKNDVYKTPSVVYALGLVSSKKYEYELALMVPVLDRLEIVKFIEEGKQIPGRVTCFIPKEAVGTVMWRPTRHDKKDSVGDIYFSLVNSPRDPLLEDVSKLFKACDNEFIPPLSERKEEGNTIPQIVKNLAKEGSWFVARLDNKTIGAIFVNYVDKRIRMLVTHPKYRQYGVATSLVDLAIQSIKDYGLTYVIVRVASNNKISLKIFESFGFKIYEKILDDRAPGIHTLWLRKDLK